MSENRTIGITRTIPMPPSAMGEPVRSYICQFSAANCICDPAAEMICPVQSRRKSGDCSAGNRSAKRDWEAGMARELYHRCGNRKRIGAVIGLSMDATVEIRGAEEMNFFAQGLRPCRPSDEMPRIRFCGRRVREDATAPGP